MDYGKLNIHVVSDNSGFPIPDATVQITSENEPESIIEEAVTNNVGQLNDIELTAPPVDYSMTPSANKPYSEYTITISAFGFESVEINGAEIFSGETAIQNASLLPLATGETDSAELFVIPDHTLWGDYPPKIPESEIKTVEGTGEIVLSRVVIPEYVIVHDGPPSDSSANDYYVRYRDYIKNVAACEIYSTWPRATLEANILAIMSFTLNRVYTEWYRNKGLNFTITSSTAYDHKFINNRNLFDTINVVVDNIFNTFIKRPPTARQPLLAQYCDGKKSQCPNQMTQWGSKDLGDQGMDYESILRYFYGDEIVFEEAPVVSGVPVSFPGDTLQVGSSGKYVKTIQHQLNAISNSYPAIPKVKEDGVYGNSTAEAVSTFQGIFGLPKTGVVDFKTWYEISRVYVAVTKIASLNPNI